MPMLPSHHAIIEAKNGQIQISGQCHAEDHIGLMVERGDTASGCLLTREQAVELAGSLLILSGASPFPAPIEA